MSKTLTIRLCVKTFFLFVFYSCAITPVQQAEKQSEKLLDKLTLRQKIGQMVMVRARGKFYHENNDRWQKLISEVEDNEVGGVILFGGEMLENHFLIAEMQKNATIPLLFASDFERGVGQQIDGGIGFPSNMAIGAANSDSLAYLQGKITATEAQALGVQMVFAPVLDVNNNPNNPIINFRSYSSAPNRVAELGNAFIRGLQDGGCIATIKHFPGHGDTETDSHTSLPIISKSFEELKKTELPPFEFAIKNGAKAIMSAHIAVPAMNQNGTNLPATLSKSVLTNYLRNELQFDGLIVTDALEMGAIIREYSAKEAAILAVEAGADILLLPLDTKQTIDAVEQAVLSGRISENRIDESVMRIFNAKLNFPQPTYSPRKLQQIIGNPKNKQIAQSIAEKTITLVKDETQSIPIVAKSTTKIVHITLSEDDRIETIRRSLERKIKLRVPNVECKIMDSRTNAEEISEIIQSVRNADICVISAVMRIHMNKGSAVISETLANQVRKIISTGKPTIVMTYGSPYLLNQISEIPTYLCAYGYGDASLEAGVRAIFGECDISASLPVELAGFSVGDGIILDSFAPARAVLAKGVADATFPGAAALVLHENKIVFLDAIGKFTYKSFAEPVQIDTRFDLASVTKVIVPTTLCMQLYEQDSLQLDLPIARWIPEFQTGEKSKITIRHLLTHTSGLSGYITFFKHCETRSEILDSLKQTPLVRAVGTGYEYSDLGIILLGEVLETMLGKPLDILAENRIFRPLEMTQTCYNPHDSLRAKISPTEFDYLLRNRLIQGEVHDENTFVMGGVSAHAGVFSTVEDLAKFANAMLTGKTPNGTAFLRAETIAYFTSRANIVPKSGRALGWDKPSLIGSSAGDYFSAESFGHLGFTGTSIWIDPTKNIAIILLTNRVHLTRENIKIRRFRPTFHNAVSGVIQSSFTTKTR